MKTPEEIYDILDKALAEKKAAGFTIKSGGGIGDDCFCAVQAVSGNTSGFIERARKLFCVQGEDVWAITFGFDGFGPPVRGREDLYQIGQRLRAKYLS